MSSMKPSHDHLELHTGKHGKKQYNYQRYCINDVVTHAIARGPLQCLRIRLLLKIQKDLQCISSMAYSSLAYKKRSNHMHPQNNHF